MKNLLKGAAATSLIALASQSGVGVAQSIPAAGGAGPIPQQADNAAGEIIVTAQKRAENALKSSLAISVLNAKTLDANAVHQVDDLQRVAPSLSVTDNGITRYVNIRGVGLAVSAPGVANGVAYFIDGLFLPSAPLYQDGPYFDVARIEVLRGPQGTLVGQSSTGGAIYVVSQAPELGVTNGFVQQSVGNYRDLRTQGAVNVPLGTHWAARIAAQVEDRESFYKYVTPTTGGDPNRPGDLTRYNARASLYGEIGALDVTIRSQFGRKRSGGTTGKPIPGDPVDTPYVAAAPSNPFTVNYDAATKDNVTSSESSIDLDLQVADNVKARSLSGITTGHRDFAQDSDGSSLQGRTRSSDIGETNYSEEANLLSTGGSPLQWVVGAFEIYQRLHGTNVFVTQSAPYTPAAPSITIAHGESGNNSFGAYGQATYRMSPLLQVLGGVRYSIDHNQSFDGSYNIQNGQTHPNPGRATSRAVTGKASINLTPSPNQFIYLTASRGYKAGGFNDATSIFKPETVWNYETGIKSSFLGGEIHTQIDGYYENYQNIQVTVYDPYLAFSNIANGTKATVYGAEAEMAAQLGALSLDASAAYNHSRLAPVRLVDPRLLPYGGTIPLCSFGPGPCTFDFTPYTVNLAGKSLPFAPHWTAHAGASYEVPFGRGTITPRVTVSYLGKQFASLFAEVPADVIPSRTLVDALITYKPARALSIEAYMTNAFNKVYISGKFEDLQYYGSPRQFGLRVGYDF